VAVHPQSRKGLLCQVLGRIPIVNEGEGESEHRRPATRVDASEALVDRRVERHPSVHAARRRFAHGRRRRACAGRTVTGSHPFRVPPGDEAGRSMRPCSRSERAPPPGLAPPIRCGRAAAGRVPRGGAHRMNSGDTAWMLMSTALVMIMLPGLALFYGGLVRRKNVLSTIMHSFFGLAIVSVVWVLVGFSLAFGPDANLFGIPGLVGNLSFAGFMGVGLEPSATYATTIPFVLFAAFQLMFAAITP